METFLKYLRQRSANSLNTPNAKITANIIIPIADGNGALKITLKGRYINRSGTIPK